MTLPATLSLPLRIGILFFCFSFWLGQYFFINHSKLGGRPRKLWVTKWDSVITFSPLMIIPYLSVYIFGILPFFLISQTRLFLLTLSGYFLTTVIGSGIHILLPSQVLRHENTPSKEISWRLIGWFQRLCQPYDNFPSTHVAFSVLTVGTCLLSRGPIIGVVFMLWAFLIAVSTLMAKQHYVLDVVSGGFLGLTVFALIWLIY
jgi:membrane-associated phospholipid phosphatase